MSQVWLPYRTKVGIAIIAVILALTGFLLLPQHSGSTVGASIISTPYPKTTAPTRKETLSRTTFDSPPLHGQFALERSHVLAGEPSRVFAQLTVSAENTFTSLQPDTANLVLVIDTSGSMAGRKIQDARQAIGAIIRDLGPRDRFAIVQFSSKPRMVLPFGQAARDRNHARSALMHLQPSGSTDIGAALAFAYDLLKHQRHAGPGRIVLVTDGRDTSGNAPSVAVEQARKASAKGLTVSALGIGADYDDANLADIASAGRGNYEYLANAASLRTFVSKELQQTRRTAAIDVTAHLRLPEGARILQVWGANLQSNSEQAGLTLGSLFAGDERRATLLVALPSTTDGDRLMFDIDITWLTPREQRNHVSCSPVAIEVTADRNLASASLDQVVHADAVSVRASSLEKKAAEEFGRGNRNAALTLNRHSRKLLADAAKSTRGEAARRLKAQSKTYESNRSVYEHQAASPSAVRALGAREVHNLDRREAY